VAPGRRICRLKSRHAYKLLVNLKTAKATSIELPERFMALADEVIE
jgi:hypothetical protein